MSTPSAGGGKGPGWTVRRVGDDKLELTLPDNLKFTGDPKEPATIEDVLSAIANSMHPAQGTTLRCCSGNTAIA